MGDAVCETLSGWRVEAHPTVKVAAIEGMGVELIRFSIPTFADLLPNFHQCKSIQHP